MIFSLLIGCKSDILDNAPAEHNSHRSLKQKTHHEGVSFFLAEREGFEPPVPLGTPGFKTGVIDHSTIFPW